MATTQYVAQGGDGYDILKGCEVVINEMTGIYLEDLILKFFRAECIQVKEKPANLIEKYSLKENESKYPQFPPDLFAYKNNPPRIKRMGKLVKKFVLGPDGKFYIMISPEI